MPTDRPLAVVAEDDAILRMEAADLLVDLGFDVLEAGHAADAMRHLEARESIALLFTDIDMPGLMDGCDLAHVCVERWPDTRIIVCSGCHPDEAEQLPDGAHFIPKPCVDKLVRRALTALQLH